MKHTVITNPTELERAAAKPARCLSAVLPGVTNPGPESSKVSYGTKAEETGSEGPCMSFQGI